MKAAPGLVLSLLRVLIMLHINVIVEGRVGGCLAVAVTVTVHDTVAEGRGAGIGISGLATVGGCKAVKAGTGVRVRKAEGRRVGRVGAPVGMGTLLISGLALPLGVFVGDKD
jgi:hypothetical protein